MILNIVPANALAPGKYNCETGVFDNSLSSNYIEIDPFNVAFGNDCVGHANIPQGVEEIDGAAFALNTSITSVTIPDSVTFIGDSAFAGTSITSVTIPDSVTVIDEGAFSDTLITSVTIPDSVTTLGQSAFSIIPSLTSVTIGTGLTSIPDFAFELNPLLTSVYFLGNAPTVSDYAFLGAANGAKAYVFSGKTGYPENNQNWKGLIVVYRSEVGGGSGGDNPATLDFPWVGDQSIACPEANPWTNEKLDFAKNVKPVLPDAENSVGRTITHDSYELLKSSGVLFDTVSKKVNTATETLPDFGCKDRLLSGKINQPIQFIAGGYTLQSDAHGYINTADQIWHDLNEVTLTTNTAAFMHTIKFTKTGKYMVVLTEQPDISAGISPTYGARSIRFVININ